MIAVLAARAVLQAETLWLRSSRTSEGFRLGVEYFRGPSALTQFFDQRDHSVSAGVWIHF